jgi:hypothetical protein
MTVWSFANIALSAVVFAILFFKLMAHFDQFNSAERIGMGLLGAAMIMNIGPLLMIHGGPFHCHEATPFDDWGSTMLRLGCAIYFVGRMIRHIQWGRR